MNNYCKTFNSKYGNILILWKLINDLPKIYKIYLNMEKLISIGDIKHSSEELSCKAIDATMKNIHSYFAGETIKFDLAVVDLDVCSSFQKKVILTEYNIPRGYVSTYKRIANHLKKPDGARAVGNALATNPFPIIIPCHRAIKTDGSLGGYQGGMQMKYELLKMEGIKFNDNRKVLLGKVYY
jgi:methylated-DNA-[protein]-cysteine S-methyltransferase